MKKKYAQINENHVLIRIDLVMDVFWVDHSTKRILDNNACLTYGIIKLQKKTS